MRPVRRVEVLIARSRAVDAREPGQVREEAALSDTAHAPRGSLEGAKRDGHARGPISTAGARSASEHFRPAGRLSCPTRTLPKMLGPSSTAGARSSISGRRGPRGTRPGRRRKCRAARVSSRPATMPGRAEGAGSLRCDRGSRRAAGCRRRRPAIPCGPLDHRRERPRRDCPRPEHGLQAAAVRARGDRLRR